MMPRTYAKGCLDSEDAHGAGESAGPVSDLSPSPEFQADVLCNAAIRIEEKMRAL